MKAMRRLVLSLGCCLVGLVFSPLVALGEGAQPESPPPVQSSAGLLSSGAIPTFADAVGASPLTSRLVAPGFLQGEQLAAERQARLASPGALAARGESQLKYSGLDRSAVSRVLKDTFPGLIDSPAGGRPQLPAGSHIVRFRSVNSAQVELASGRHSVIESTVPMALRTTHGLMSMNLGLTADGETFKPKSSLVGVRIPKRLSHSPLTRTLEAARC
jgi:hypothetical protein